MNLEKIREIPLKKFMLIPLGIPLGLLIAGTPLFFVFLLTLIGIFVLASVIEPAIGILTLLVLKSSVVFEEALPLIPIGVGSFHIADALLIFLLCLTLFKKTFNRNYINFKTVLDWPLLIFYLAALLSVWIATAHFQVNFNIAMRELRSVSYYLLFFSCKNLVREKSQIKIVVIGIFVIAAVVAATMILQALIGVNVQLMPGRVESARTFGQTYEATRVIPPGEFLIYVAFVTVFCVFFSNKNKTLNFINCGVLFILGISVALTYSRSMWFTIFCLITIYMIISTRENKIRAFVPIILIIGLSGIFIFAFSKDTEKVEQYKSSISSRFSSMFKVQKLLDSGSFSIRGRENIYAMNCIVENPLLGIGLGNKYRQGGLWEGDEGRYIHNGYLYVLLKMGIIGFIPFLTLSVIYVVRGFNNRKRINSMFLRAILEGFTLSYLGLIFILFFSPKIMERPAIPVIAVMLGISERIIISGFINSFEKVKLINQRRYF